MDFSSYQAVLLDLDGTVYHGEHVLAGAASFLGRLHARKVLYACLSNSNSSPQRIVHRLQRMGISMEARHIFSAAAAAADYVMERFGPRPRIFNLASQGTHDLLDGQVDWVQTGGEPCHAIIIGAPTSLFATEPRQRIALELARKGAALIGISFDRVYPSPRGIEFGSGALTWMLAYAAAAEPVFCGKPQAIFFSSLCQRLGVLPQGCILIGDNLESDIAGAKAMGMRTVLTLTGVTRRRDLLAAPPEMRPDWVVEDLSEL